MKDKETNNDSDIKPELIGKNTPKGNHIKAEILAQINQYTDRPDLLLETLEKHDPGFIQYMNKLAKEKQDKTSEIKFKFGKHQAYTSLVIQVIAALSLLSGLILLIYSGKAGFWNLAGLAVLYAVTQGGADGFKKLIEAIASTISKFKKTED